jgi:acyl-CoA thioesterase-1
MRSLYGAVPGAGKRAFALVLLLAGLWAGAAAFAAAAAAAPVQILILGDSLTAGHGLPLADGFQARLAAALQARGADVALIDGAVSGDTSTDAAARLDWVLAGGKVNAAFVELGGNDGLRGLDPATMERNLSHILDVLAARHIPVLLSGMLPPPSLGATYTKQFTDVYEKLGHRPGVIFDPFFLAGIAAHPALLQDDEIHPNAQGVDFEVARLTPLFMRLIAQAR